jgi:hypothetical protein
MFTDKGDTFHGDRRVTCGACSTTSTIANPLMDHSCPCGRVLNGIGRRGEPDLSK